MPRLILVATLAIACVHLNTLQAKTVIVEDVFDQPIPAGDDGHQWMDPVTLNVDHHFTIEDLNVTLSITHSDISDLEITLISPTGQSVILKNVWIPLWRQPRTNMTNTTFDDNAQTYAIDSQPPYSGSFRPEPGNVLSDFNTLDAFGQWTLNIYDAYYADSGTLDHLCLTFTTPHTPEPASLTTLAILTLLTLRRKKHF